MKKILIFATVIFSTTLFLSCNKNQQATNNTEEQTQKVEVATNKKTIHLTKSEFIQKVANYESSPNEWKYLGDKPCIIDFYATWCPPCKAIAPVLEGLASEYDGQIYIYKIDVDKEPELATAFGIRSIPTLMFVPMKGEPITEVGNVPKDMLVERIKTILQ